MSDPKKLRELMKKEKERRAGGSSGAAVARSSRPAPRGAGLSPAAALAQVRVTAGGQAGGSSGSSSAPAAAVTLSEAPAAKRQRGDADVAAAAPPASVAVTAAQAAASDMPPPPVPVLSARQRREAASETAPAPVKTEETGSVAVPSALVDYADDAVSIAASEDDTVEKVKEASGDDAVEAVDGGPTLPEGFFDDPDMDAKVRGAEAPSVRAQRELEEGLKRFEKEMVVEAEKAEETRHELDEEKYERAFAEEQEFQNTLHGRLDRLRQRAAEKLALRSKTAAAAAAPASEPVDNGLESADGDSGSDVEFDWRAKGFG